MQYVNFCLECGNLIGHQSWCRLYKKGFDKMYCFYINIPPLGYEKYKIFNSISQSIGPRRTF